jgi:hypothetical protein
MHDPAYRYVASFAAEYEVERILEFGSRNVNGSVRPLFDGIPYHGIDLAPGRDVDEVADAATFRLNTALVDCVICCEVLEHTPKVAEVVRSAYENLEPDGWFVVTCATHGRPPHSAVTGAALQPDEFYRNVDPAWFCELLVTEGFDVVDSVVNDTNHDLYVTAQKRE